MALGYPERCVDHSLGECGENVGLTSSEVSITAWGREEGAITGNHPLSVTVVPWRPRRSCPSLVGGGLGRMPDTTLSQVGVGSGGWSTQLPNQQRDVQPRMSVWPAS